MWINLDDEISQLMHHKIKEKDGQLTRKQRIVILDVDLYSKEVDAGN